ncbi:FecR family protein [Chitinophaga sp. GCM10012297]|uniref:FecR family protein n=1 Tax=Chitinophaga chungangae TaxID=2821488 RepID=A0ABS3Y995_9BACT|nr:FecR family protein [Chitinophaga chungangae]MBO9151251.1 FecR family protein [Chitinophaga chungangae]
MLRERLLYLMERYFQGACTEDERRELAQFIGTEQDDDLLKEVLDDTWERFQPESPMPEAMSGRIQRALTGAPVVPVRKRRPLMAAAAAVLLLLAAGGLWLSREQSASVQQPSVAQVQKAPVHDVAPGGSKAVLTLGDGTVIELDSSRNGVVAQQGSVKVVKLANGQLAYEREGQAPAEILFNTMRTPRGGEYRLTLPDGSRVWLNAASSVTYPTMFAGEIREVSITGEAYFEVAERADMPFRVKTAGMTVEVLGTHFNVNAYTEEKTIRTTLLEGAVKVRAGGSEALLKPGQQAGLQGNGRLNIKNNVNVDEVVAWKNGLFQFTDADMPAVMRQLENWYDVNVIYEGNVPERSFGGAIQRSLPLAQVLKILEESNVKFRLEGRNIYVMK